jgi:hypothetical protein
VALGEDAASGGFAGAGTNGGTNVGIFVNSCGFRSRYLDAETSFVFAGIHMLMGTMPIAGVLNTSTSATSGSDTAQWSLRGDTFGHYMNLNPSAAAADAWLNPTMANYGFTRISPGAPTDGAQVVMSKDVSLAKVQSHTGSETWAGARLESNDATGVGWFWYRYTCNYNCSALGM